MRRLVAVGMVLGSLAVVAPADAYRRPGTIQRVSSGRDNGVPGPVRRDSAAMHAYGPDISVDGRYVAYVSRSVDEVPGDVNSAPDVFRWERSTGRTELVSVSLGGRTGVGTCRNLAQPDGVYDGSYLPAISADGRHVAFSSCATDLVPGDTNASTDVFVRDMVAGVTTRVSVSSSGGEAPIQPIDGPPARVAISADGRHVAFVSSASGLVPGATNGMGQVYVHDRKTRRTVLASAGPGGVAGDHRSDGPALSAGGRFLSFTSYASNLVAGVTGSNVFVRDLATGRNDLVHVGMDGEPANAGVEDGVTAISADGRHVAFVSGASNLVPRDTVVGLFSGYDVFVRDRAARRTERVSVSSTGEPGDANSFYSVDLSPDARYVGFTSRAGNWFPTGGRPDDALFGGQWHVFRYDRRSGALDWLSAPPHGRRATGLAGGGAISADGRYVVFQSDADDLVANDTHTNTDTFLSDVGPGVGTGAISATSSGDALAGAALVPRQHDLFVRLDVRRMPILAGLDLTAGGTQFRVLATQTVPGASFRLLRLDGAVWVPVATLEGGYGTTGLSIVVAVPRDLLPSGPIDDLRAFTEAGVS